MYQPMLFVHWKQARLLLIPFVMAAFGLPLLQVQGLGPGPGGEAVTLSAVAIVSAYQIWLPVFPLFAAAVGAMLALTAWNWDHQHQHVYALSLPLARWEYAMLKMGAGVVLLLIPAGALWLGSHVAAAAVSLPDGLRAYPNELALRFLLSTLLAYALFFAMAAGTIKTTVWVVTGVIAFFFVGDLLSRGLAVYVPLFEDVNIAAEVARWFVSAGGPLEVFTGNWALIDV